jgi:hypothetical protein
MRSAIICLVFCVLSGSNGTALASDLSKIDRSIRREPAYRSTPKYCLLVFGPKAEHRVWLVLDGESLYVDRNGNGDLTDDGNPVRLAKWEDTKKEPMYERTGRTNAGDLKVGGLTHELLQIHLFQSRRKVDPMLKDAEDWQSAVDEIWKQSDDGIIAYITLNLDPQCYGFQDADAKKHNSATSDKFHHGNSYSQGHLVFAASREKAPVLHFGGPLTVRAAQTELRRDKKGDRLMFELGTFGVGPGTFVAAHMSIPPLNLNPQVEIEFPSGQQGQPALVRKFVLGERCCGTKLYGVVHAPDVTEMGAAKVTFSFPDWKEAKISPATFTLRIVP